MRDAISKPEMQTLAEALKNGATWEQAKALLPGVDPVVLDKNFKDSAFRSAGIEVEKPLKSKKSEKNPDPLE